MSVFLKQFCITLINRKKFISLLLILLIIFRYKPLEIYAQAESQYTIKVGYFPMGNFHNYDETGNPIGYDVDYLNEIQKYTGWNFEYIRIKDTTEALKYMMEGKIDLLGGCQITKDRIETSNYTTYPAGLTYRVLLTLNGNDALSYLDFESMEDVTFGCHFYDIYKKPLLDYLISQGLHPHIEYYDTVDEMRSALHSGEIDVIMTDMMDKTDKEKLLAKFEPSSFYYMMSKSNAKFLKTLNDALATIQIENPDFERSLREKWFSYNNAVPFSRSELEFANSYPILDVGIVSNRSPISWYNHNTNTMEGIVPQILDLISENSGLQFNYVPIEEGTAPIPALKEGSWDLVAGVIHSESNMNDPDIQLSKSFLLGLTDVYGRKGEAFYTNAPIKIAIPKGFTACKESAMETFPNAVIYEYVTTEDCLNAVKTKKVDIMMQNSYVTTQLLTGPKYSNIERIPTLGIAENLCIAISKDIDPILLSIINKAISQLPDDAINQIVINNTSAIPYKPSLTDFFIQYHNTIIIVGIFLLIIIIIVWYIIKEKKRHHQLIIDKEKMLSNIANNINGGVVTIIPDTGFTITYANNGFLDLIGYSREEYDNASFNSGIAYVHPNDITKFNETMQHIKNDEQLELELHILHRKRGYVPVLFRGTFSEDIDHNPLFYCVIVDITNQKQMIEDLAFEKDRYRLLIEQSDHVIFDIDVKSRCLSFSSKFKEKFGLDAPTTFNNDFLFDTKYIYSKDISTIQNLMDSIKSGLITANCRIRLQKSDKTYIWCDIIINLIDNNNYPQRIIGKIVDVDAQVRENERLTKLSERDQLTGLYNKTAFSSTVSLYLEDFESGMLDGAVYFIDLDHFKTLNDSQGHLMGDTALKEVSNILKEIFREEDTIGRFGGDEFFVFVKNVPHSILEKKANQICRYLRLNYCTEGITTSISASVGIYHFEGKQFKLDDILKRADEALYIAKERGRNNYVFYRDIKKEIKEGLILDKML